MKPISPAETKSSVSTQLEQVDAGAVVAADAFRELWMNNDDLDLSPPIDPAAEPVESLND